MNSSQVSARVDKLISDGQPAGQAISQAVTEADRKRRVAGLDWLRHGQDDGSDYGQPLGAEFLYATHAA
jgi:hypothetical protein